MKIHSDKTPMFEEKLIFEAGFKSYLFLQVPPGTPETDSLSDPWDVSLKMYL